MSRESELTPWDTWVLWCLMFAIFGTTVLLWMAFVPDSRNPRGFYAAVTCLVYALVGLCIAKYRWWWIQRWVGEEDDRHH